jgi:ABC-type Fe3+-siderophore transport system permease subunit
VARCRELYATASQSRICSEFRVVQPVGAVAAFAAGIGDAGWIALSAFVGAAIAVLLALLVARAAGRGGRGDPRTLLMAGVVIGAFANAVIMVALANAPPNTVRGALWWMMGSAGDATWQTVTVLAVSILVGGAALIYLARDIDVLALGEEPAACTWRRRRPRGANDLSPERSSRRCDRRRGGDSSGLLD